MIELKVEISDVDYANILEKAIPEILPKMAKNHGEMVEKLLLSLNGKSGEMMKKALLFLPKSVQDEIAVSILSSYKEQILNGIHKMADEQNVSITVSDITVGIKDKTA